MKQKVGHMNENTEQKQKMNRDSGVETAPKTDAVSPNVPQNASANASSDASLNAIAESPRREIGSIDMEKDIESFVELCLLSFGDEVTVDKEMYDWYFTQNPYNPPGTNMMYVLREHADDSTAKVIAADGLFPFELYVNGKTYQAAHSVESMTHPDYMRQGIFRKMTENSLAKAKEHGLDIVLGLANKNSYGAYEKFGWKTLFEKRIHIRPIHIYTRLRRNLRMTFLSGIIASFYYLYDGFLRFFLARRASGYVSTVADEVPNSLNECFDRYKDAYGTLIVRDEKYLNYRYVQRPDKHYKFLVIRKKEDEGKQAIEGFAVVRVCDLKKNKMLTVAEFFCNPDDEKAVNALIKAIVDYGYANVVEYIVVSVGGNKKLKAVLAKNGFKLNTKPLLNNMMIAQDVSGKLDLNGLANEEQWMITQGDGEAELHI